MNIYSATSSPLPSIVKDNVAYASLKAIVSSNAEWREFATESNCSAKGQSCADIDFFFNFRTSLLVQEATPPHHCSHACHTTLNEQFQQPFAFEIFINPALSVLPKFTKT